MFLLLVLNDLALSGLVCKKYIYAKVWSLDSEVTQSVQLLQNKKEPMVNVM